MSTAGLTNLAELRLTLWQELARAAAEPGHAWRTPVLATCDGDGADARTVVLREVDAAAQQLRLFSDARAAKVQQIMAQPLGMLVLWSPLLSWQLRLRVQLTVDTEGLAVASRWARMQHSRGAQDYLAAAPPGSPVQAHTPPPLAQRAHFALVTAQVLAMDWLALNPAGHRRAQFKRGEDGRWVTP